MRDFWRSRPSPAMTAAKLGGNVRAYASVDLDEALIAGQSKGVIDMDVPVDGLYCFELASKPDVAVTSATTSAAVNTVAQGAVPAAPECADSAEAAVSTVRVDPPSLVKDTPFFVIFN